MDQLAIYFRNSRYFNRCLDALRVDGYNGNQLYHRCMYRHRDVEHQLRSSVHTYIVYRFQPLVCIQHIGVDRCHSGWRVEHDECCGFYR